MLVFPLGLGSKLRHVPVVTICIGLAWVLTFLFDRSDVVIFKRTMTAVSSSGVRDQARALFKEYCLSRHGKAKDCEKYSVLVLTGFPGRGDTIYQRDKSKELKKSSLVKKYKKVTTSGVAAAKKKSPKPSRFGESQVGRFKKVAKNGKSSGQKSRGKLTQLDQQKLLKTRNEIQIRRLVSEFKNAQTVRSELKFCRASRSCFVYKDILWRFLGNYRDNPNFFTNMESYGVYRQALASYHNQLYQVCKDYACLVKGNITPLSLLAAQLRHGGFGHLFGNLIMFILFGVYVEQRLGWLRYVVITAAGGTIGMAAHMVFFAGSDSMALGGSANVSTVMGMFFVLFFHHRMRFLVWLPRKIYAGTSFLAPVKYSFPLLFVLSDVSGLLDSGFATLAETNIAHFAHLVGLLVGMVAAWVILRVEKLPWFFVHLGEAEEMEKLKSLQSIDQVLRQAKTIVEINKENVEAMEHAAGVFLRWTHVAGLNENAALLERGREFLAQNMAAICAVNTRMGSYRYACRVLSQVPLFMPYKFYLGRLGQVNTLMLADYALANGHPFLTLRLYDYFLAMFPYSRKAPGVEQSAMEVLARLTSHDENIHALKSFKRYHPDSYLTPSVNSWLRLAKVA